MPTPQTSSHSSTLNLPRLPLHDADLLSATAQVHPMLPEVSSNALEEAYNACREITRRRARNFYYGLRLIPEPRRAAIYSIYAWMRHGDDIVDAETSSDERFRQLTVFRERTAAILDGHPPKDHQDSYWLAFAATVHSYPIPHKAIHEMMLGLEDDLHHTGYDTEEDLLHYCYRVASIVGLVCISIWGIKSNVDVQKVHDLAIRKGLGFQLTNILRDFAEDYDQSPSRLYLPGEAFTRYNLTPEQLRNWSQPQACEQLIAEQAAHARAHYAASSSLKDLIAPDCAPALNAMTLIYSNLLGIIEKEPARIVAKKRIRLSSTRKAAIAIRAWRSIPRKITQ